MVPRPLRVLVLASVLAAPLLAQDDRAPALLAARATRGVEPHGADPASRAAGPGKSLFHFVGADNAVCVRSVADVNGDGLEDLLVGIDHSGADNVFCLSGASSGAATVLWSYQTADGVSGGAPYGDQCVVPIPDVEGNGFSNFLLGTGGGGRTAYQLDAQTGLPQWKLDTYLQNQSGWVYSLCEVSDVTGDGVPECAFGTGSFNDSVQLVDGATMGGAQARVLWRYQPGDVTYSVRDLGDANGDGADDVLAAVGDNVDRIVCLDSATSDPAGHELWSYDPKASVYACGVLPDITGDGVDEALAVLWTTDGSAVRCLSGATGALVWASTEVRDYAMMVDTLRDVTGDGVDDLVVGSWDNAVIVLDGAHGHLVWRTPVGTLNGGDVWTVRAIDDLDGDGLQDVIAGSFDEHVYALDGDSGRILWAYDTGNRVFSVHPIGDLDGDGRPEVAAGTQDTTSKRVVEVLQGDAGIPFPGLVLSGTFAIGSVLRVELTGTPGLLAVPVLAGATASVLLPHFTGLLGIAPPYEILPAFPLPPNGSASEDVLLPDLPSLVGAQVFAQGATLTTGPITGQLTNVEGFTVQ